MCKTCQQQESGGAQNDTFGYNLLIKSLPFNKMIEAVMNSLTCIKTFVKEKCTKNFFFFKFTEEQSSSYFIFSQTWR